MRRTAQLFRSLLSILITTAGQGIQFLRLAVSSRAELSAEVLFLRKQLAFYQEHQVQPRKLTDAARFSLLLWSRLFNWRKALMIVKPETLIGWHRKGFKLFWRWESRLKGVPRPEGIACGPWTAPPADPINQLHLLCAEAGRGWAVGRSDRTAAARTSGLPPSPSSLTYPR
jgi:hypothetical protein